MRQEPGILCVTFKEEVAVCSLIRIVFTAKEDEMLQDVRQSVIVLGLSWQAEVTVHHRGLSLGHRHRQPRQLRAEFRNRYVGIRDLEVV